MRRLRLAAVTWSGPWSVLYACQMDALSTATELMLRQCCAPAFNRAKPNSISHNDIQLGSKLSAGLARNQLDSLGLLGLVSIFES